MRDHFMGACCAAALFACSGLAHAGGAGGFPGSIPDGDSTYTSFGSGTTGRAGGAASAAEASPAPGPAEGTDARAPAPKRPPAGGARPRAGLRGIAR